MFTGQIHSSVPQSRGKHQQIGDEETQSSTNRSMESLETEATGVAVVSGKPDTMYRFHLRKTEKWSKWIYYVGYIIIIVNSFAMLLTILNILGFIDHESVVESRKRQENRDYLIEQRQNMTEQDKQAQEALIDIEERKIRLHDMVYSPGQENLDLCFKLLDELLCILQGWFMVKATALLLRQLKAVKKEGAGSRIQIRFQKKVEEYQNYVWGIIIFLVFIKVARSVWMYILVDDFLKTEFKDSYKEWKLLQKEGQLNSQISQQMQRDEFDINHEYKEMEKIWSEFGIFTSLVMISFTISCCSMVLCCFTRLQKNLVRYENDPHNPANGNNI